MHRLAGALEDRSEELAMLEARNAGKPIGDARGEIGHGGRHLPLLRRRARAAARADHPRGRGSGHDLPRAAGRGGADRALELPPGDRLVEGGARRWPPATRSCSSRPSSRRSPRSSWSASRSRRDCRRACSTWWPGRAACAARGWWSTPTWPRSPSPDRRAVGRGIAAGAAGTIKRVTLELGGKSANVVFADADLGRAAAAAPLAVFGNAGQDCCARSRILVERSAMDEFVEPAGRARARPARGRPARRVHADGPADLGGAARAGVLLRGRRRAGRRPGQRPGGSRLLVSADGARRRCPTTTALRARRSSGPWCA